MKNEGDWHYRYYEIFKAHQMPTSIVSFMKAQVLFWLLAATDGHAKNFSVLSNQEGRSISSPL